MFSSSDGNLVRGDTNKLRDVFVRDISQGRTISVSAGDGVFPGGVGAFAPVISGNGRYVCEALLDQDGVGISRWRWRMRISRVDLESGNAQTLVTLFEYYPFFLGNEMRASMSRDGNLVAFVDSFRGKVHLRNMSLETDQVVSIHPGGYEISDCNLFELSRDSTSVLFWQGSNLYLRDLERNQTTLITNALETVGSIDTPNAVFSADSEWIAYSATALRIFLYSRQANTSTLICTQCDVPSISGNGQLTVYEDRNVFPRNVYLKDVAGGTTRLISKNIGGTGGGNADSYLPSISADGRFVVFTSKANNLVLNDSNGWADIFVADLVQGTLLRIAGDIPKSSALTTRRISALHTNGGGSPPAFGRYRPDPQPTSPA